MKEYPFFLAQVNTFGYVEIYSSILLIRHRARIVTDEMLTLPKWRFAIIGMLEALGVVTGYVLCSDAARASYTNIKSEGMCFASSQSLISEEMLEADYLFETDTFKMMTTRGNGAYIGLAPPGDVGSLQTEFKVMHLPTLLFSNNRGYSFMYNLKQDYQFWTESNLYAWVSGFLGDYRYHVPITVTPGCGIDVGDLVYEPPRDGPTLWEIGIPDRSAAEFHVPEPDPKYVNQLFINNPKCNFRQYGLWVRYGELYPNGDLVFTVGESDYCKDWFYAQVPRRKEDGSYEGTTWQIKFRLENVQRAAIYKLRMALAGATLSEVHVQVNDPNKPRQLFTTGLMGRDNAIARHGIHGLYWLYNIDISGALLVEGENNIYLKQPRNQSPFQVILYDYLRLEGPPC